MKREELQLLKELLSHQRVLSLAVLIEGAPYVGLLPFVARPDYGALFIHASGLALHTRGLGRDAPFAALIQAPDRPEADPLQIPRVTLQGRVRPLAREEAEYATTRELYLHRFPASEMTFSLGDFRLYELTVERGRFVAGFGSAHTLNRSVLAGLAGAEPGAAT